MIIQKQTFGVDNVNYLLYNKITINIQITQNKIIGGLLSMNKNKIFKNLKKLTAVSLTTANLFTFANSGSAKILNLNNKEDKKIVLEFIKKSGFSDRLKDEKNLSFNDLVKTLCNGKEVTGQTEIYKTDTPIDFLKVDQGNTPVKNMEPNQLYVYDVTALEKENQKNTENYYNGDEMKQNNFISLDDFIKSVVSIIDTAMEEFTDEELSSMIEYHGRFVNALTKATKGEQDAGDKKHNKGL